MQIGDLTHRIDVQSYTVTTDENGQQLPVWTTLSTVWARVVYESAGESTEADQLTAVQTVKFFVRYLSTINELMRIRWEGQYYKINAIEEIGLRRFLVLRAEWKDSRWFDILRDTGHGIRGVDDDNVRAVGHNSEAL